MTDNSPIAYNANRPFYKRSLAQNQFGGRKVVVQASKNGYSLGTKSGPATAQYRLRRECDGMVAAELAGVRQRSPEVGTRKPWEPFCRQSFRRQSTWATDVWVTLDVWATHHLLLINIVKTKV